MSEWERKKKRDKKEEFSELPQNIRPINTLGVGRGLCRCLTDLLALHPKTCVQNKSSKCYRKLRFTFSVHRTHTHFLRASIFFRLLFHVFSRLFFACANWLGLQQTTKIDRAAITRNIKSIGIRTFHVQIQYRMRAAAGMQKKKNVEKMVRWKTETTKGMSWIENIKYRLYMSDTRLSYWFKRVNRLEPCVNSLAVHGTSHSLTLYTSLAWWWWRQWRRRNKLHRNTNKNNKTNRQQQQ